MPTGASWHHPNATCTGLQAVHGYEGAGGPFAGVRIHGAIPDALDARAGPAAQQFSSGTVEAVDSCPTHYDGDAEWGVGGARFPAGTRGEGCSPRWTPHHGHGHGAPYWADDTSGVGSIAYRAGADGPAAIVEPSQRCLVDGLITSDPVTDPLDCGAGQTGFYVPGAWWIPATLGENVPGNGACDPYDGFVWLVVMAGADADDTAHVYMAVEGHAWG